MKITDFRAMVAYSAVKVYLSFESTRCIESSGSKVNRTWEKSVMEYGDGQLASDSRGNR